MESQGLSQGSLRNSHRETHAIKRKPAPASLQSLASKVLEKCSNDFVIRQRLDPERVEGLFKKNSFFVLENDGRAEPGFLVLLPGKPVIYMQQRRGGGGGGGGGGSRSYGPNGPHGPNGSNQPQWFGSTLRMRVSSSLAEGGGTVLVGRLDDVMHTLRLEDVWLWKGHPVFQTDTFTKRRDLLKEFVERHWVPDARLLGGIFTQVAAPMSLAEFADKAFWNESHSVEFIPDTPGKRRLLVFLEEKVKRDNGPAAMKQHRGLAGAGGDRVAPSVPTVPAVPPTPAVPAAPAPTTAVRKARAVAVDKLPDVYDLYGEDGFPISRASVQKFSLSQIIKEKAEVEKDIWVKAQWRPEFGGYEIVGLW